MCQVPLCGCSCVSGIYGNVIAEFVRQIEDPYVLAEQGE